MDKGIARNNRYTGNYYVIIREDKVEKQKTKIGTKMFHMAQECAMAIVRILLHSELHTRAIAKELGINHMFVSRRIHELKTNNVVDFRQKGKNKVYFLKKTIEARNHVFIAEIYKLNKILRLYPVLRKIIGVIQNNNKIKLAILFGSYAKGTATTDSDIDIFIESKDQTLKRELGLLNSKLSIKVGLYDTSNLVIKEIEKSHVIIKGVELYYEKSRFFA